MYYCQCFIIAELVESPLLTLIIGNGGLKRKKEYLAFEHSKERLLRFPLKIYIRGRDKLTKISIFRKFVFGQGFFEELSAESRETFKHTGFFE